MSLNISQLQQEAHQRALVHNPFIAKSMARLLKHEVESDAIRLRSFALDMRDHGIATTQPAEEWLLDHAEFIDEQLLCIVEQLEDSDWRRFPFLRDEQRHRIVQICMDYLQAMEGSLDEETFTAYLSAYQEVSVLSISELWSAPLAMRVAIIHELAEMMNQVQERRKISSQVEHLMDSLTFEEDRSGNITALLEQEDIVMPLSGTLIAQLVRQLRERADDMAMVKEWLLCKLDNGPEQLEQIIAYEQQFQMKLQLRTGHLIGALRTLNRWHWQQAFGEVCLPQKALREESSGDYIRLDQASQSTLLHEIERLAARLKVPETLIAHTAVELAAGVWKKAGAADGAMPREAFVAYYLLEERGIAKLRRSLSMCSKPRRMPDRALWRGGSRTYISLLVLLSVLAVFWFTELVQLELTVPTLAVLASAILVLPFAIEWAVIALHGLIGRMRRTRPLLRYDFSEGVPPEAATLIAVPIIWSTIEDVQETIDRLELHHLATRDQEIQYAILGDFADAASETDETDEAIERVALEAIRDLNDRYEDFTFHLLLRRRKWNDAEGVWMGWERKRGKLVEIVELLSGASDTSCKLVFGDLERLRQNKYLITLDADTMLPLGSAQRMISTMHLPYNRPRMNKSSSRVIEGYGVLQPRIGVSHATAIRSRLTYLSAGIPGTDPYAYAMSDPYQDSMGVGIFTGKGIIDVESFSKVLCDRIPDNRVLSHDLLEGGFLRTGLLQDIELVDGQPATFLSFQRRLHRWVRGDWQLIPWLLRRNSDRRGEKAPVDLSAVTRWQMIDNMRRSLLTPWLLLAPLLALLIDAKLGVRMLMLSGATLLLPLLLQSIAAIFRRGSGKHWLLAAQQLVLSLVSLPFQAMLMLDAITRTIYRLVISKRRLLEWMSSAEAERQAQGPATAHLRGGYALAAIFVLGCVWLGEVGTAATGIILGLLWLCAPFIIRWLDQPLNYTPAVPEQDDAAELRQLAQQIWSFFADYVNSQENWLPPDNVQVEPDQGIAHRTSPTNIGLYVTSVLAACDMEFIGVREMIVRLENTIGTIERMEKWEGHLFNWYDTQTLQILPPAYVSTVDSGNLVGYLIALREGVEEWLNTPSEEWHGGEPPEEAQPESRQSFAVAFAEELTAMPSSVDSARLGAGARSAYRDWQRRGQHLLERIDKLIDETNFRPLYDHKSRLLALGYHAERKQREQILYDLMASEARQASFIAIALGQISVAHWSALGRTLAKTGKQLAMLSWTGTMFEYLMPALLMKTYPQTIWDTTIQAAVNRQIDYADSQGVPYGISESGYYAYDRQLNYQYRAFGVPGLGFKRGLDQDLVVAPYATIMSLPYAHQRGKQALKEFEELGARGKYGFYEAVDYTKRRLPKNRDYMVIRSFMAHHQGMSLLTLTNLLQPERSMTERFHRDKRVQVAELLLQERLPSKPKVLKHPAAIRSIPAKDQTPAQDAVRTIDPVQLPHATPEVCLLGGGDYSVMVGASGGGYSKYHQTFVTRWREDALQAAWGSYFYIRDLGSDEVWSPTYLPCRKSRDQQIHYSLEKASFKSECEGVSSHLEIMAGTERSAELRTLTLRNDTSESKVLEVTTYQEVALAQAAADAAHPAFSKLFVRTEFASHEEALLALRRPRSEGEAEVCAAHSLWIEGGASSNLQTETDRARFIGRGYSLQSPKGIRSQLAGSFGSVADPAFVMRRRIRLEPGETCVCYAVTSAGSRREDVLEAIAYYRQASNRERDVQHGWTKGQVERRQLGLTASEAVELQQLAGLLLYDAPLRSERADAISGNIHGQSVLWSYGVSGDRPIMLVRIASLAQLSFVSLLIKGHEYLRKMGLGFDLVLLNESDEGYQQPLQDALMRSKDHDVDRFGASVQGVVVLQSATVPPDHLRLLQAVSRIVLRAGGPSLRAQLHMRGVPKAGSELLLDAEPATTQAIAPENASEERIAEISHLKGNIRSDRANTLNRQQPKLRTGGKEQLQFDNSWGGFTADGRSYKLRLKGDYPLPAPWINVMANEEFGTIVSENGSGYTWWRNSRECKLTAWNNDPVLDPYSEYCYLRDEQSGEIWSPMVARQGSDHGWQVEHGMGYTSYERSHQDIAQQMLVYVPKQDAIKLMRLTLRNQSQHTRTLSVAYYADWVLGVNKQASAAHIVTSWDAESGTLLAHNTYQESFREAVAFLSLHATGDTLQEIGYTTDRPSFIGAEGDVTTPAGLRYRTLDNSAGMHQDSCGVVRASLVLEPGEEKVIYIVLGCAAGEEAAIELRQRYRDSDVCATAFTKQQQMWEEVLQQTKIQTPSPAFDFLMNGWLLYQTLACRMWARTAFFQAGGAFGFRDQLQDSLALLHTRPDLTRRQLLLHAAHQYVEGDVQHWWHEENDRGIRTRFTDDLLWLPYGISRYISQTGDASILTEIVPYLHSSPLAEGEHERYEATVLSGTSGSVQEHCMRAIELVLSRIGEHGLPLIGIGDWNDGMNQVGSEGRGESVWLGWFLIDVLQRFAKLAETGVLVSEAQGNVQDYQELANTYRLRVEELNAALQNHAWDGNWYRRAFTDAGNWLGSVFNEECRIDAIAQSWSVISGAAPPDRAVTAMQSYDRELVDRELNVSKLLTPPFDTSSPSPGYIQGYPPGIRENGAQYTHGAIWSIVAWTMLGEGGKAFELFDLMNPINHTRSAQDVRRYMGEPYAMAADVYTAEPLKGKAGWSWYTGASGWMYQAGLEWILGVQRQNEELLIRPCIPQDWPGYTVHYRVENATYTITVTNDSGRGKGIRAAMMDGMVLVPEKEDPLMVRIKISGKEKTHRISICV